MTPQNNRVGAYPPLYQPKKQASPSVKKPSLQGQHSNVDLKVRADQVQQMQ